MSTALILFLAAVYQLVPGLLGPAASSNALGSEQLLRRDVEPSEDLECRLVYHAEDKCAFVRANCEDEAAGLLPYITFYYCSMTGAQPVAFVLLVAWLGLLFTTIGIAASDFFSVNLGSIASILGLSESLAGVTFLAFGNGSPDVFSTFAAMGSNSGSMAVGELIGAASFITCVVAGSMALVREFRVSRRTFVRDICFFIAAVAFAIWLLADGQLLLWECCAMIGFYVFYVLTVVGWHWVSTRRSRRRAREAASRSHFYGAAGAVDHGADDDLAPYHDDDRSYAGGDDGLEEEPEPDDTAPVGGRHERPLPDISALERGPRIEVESVEIPGEADTAFNEAEDQVISEEEQERRSRQIRAEMTSSMRVNRPRGRRSTMAITPIRPSLLGALEFRSVLASLQRSGTMRLAPIDRRRKAGGHRPPAISRGHTVDGTNAAGDNSSRSSLLAEQAYQRGVVTDSALTTPDHRDRAFSSGDRPLGWTDGELADAFAQPYTDVVPEADEHGALDDVESSVVSTGSSTTPVRNTSPAEAAFASASKQHVSTSTHPGQPQRRPTSGLHLEIPPSPQNPPRRSPQSSPSLSPFPGYTESTPLFSPLPPPQAPGISRSSRAEHQLDDGTSSFPGIDDANDIPRPVTWWPYQLLPPPHVILSTLFPTLSGWRDKTVWDKFVSLISAPTVFLLVITLPVVEMETQTYDKDEEMDDVDAVLDAGDFGSSNGNLISGEEAATTSGEWQRYWRSATAGWTQPSVVTLETPPEDGPDLLSTAASESSSAEAATAAAAETGDSDTDETAIGHSNGTGRDHVPAIASTLENPRAKAVDAVMVGACEAEAVGWNRWLVAVQLVAGPIFTAFVLWANMAEDMKRPGRQLAVMMLVALVAACAMLAVLLTTTTAKRRPKYHSLLCFLGFVISVAWISTVAGEVVGVLKAIGVIAGISEAILGLTIFAVGNSLGDLVADITVARLGYPVMALYVFSFLPITLPSTRR